MAFLLAIETAMRSGRSSGSPAIPSISAARRPLPLTENSSPRNVPLSTRAVALLRMPLQERLMEVNQWVGQDVVRFDPYALGAEVGLA